MTHGARIGVGACRSANAGDNVRSEHIVPRPHRLRDLRDGGRLFAEALGSASGRGAGVDGIGRGLPLASAARAYLSHCFAALTHFCTDREAECW